MFRILRRDFWHTLSNTLQREPFSVARSKGRKDEEKEVKRTLGHLDSPSSGQRIGGFDGTCKVFFLGLEFSFVLCLWRCVLHSRPNRQTCLFFFGRLGYRFESLERQIWKAKTLQAFKMRYYRNPVFWLLYKHRFLRDECQSRLVRFHWVSRHDFGLCMSLDDTCSIKTPCVLHALPDGHTLKTRWLCKRFKGISFRGWPSFHCRWLPEVLLCCEVRWERDGGHRVNEL